MCARMLVVAKRRGSLQDHKRATVDVEATTEDGFD